MESFSQSQIARLVLGYLKAEKCSTAYEAFLDTSSHLKEYRENFMTTRVLGLTLIDYLTEYALLYNIIQGRLEHSDYYNTVQTKQSLSEQLLYLLDKEPRRRSLSRSPPRKKARTLDISTNTEIPENNTININATPLESLPGNVSHHSSKNDEDGSTTSEERAKAIDVGIVTQTLLGNHELHEKLAETINNVVNTPELTTAAMVASNDKNCAAGAAAQDIDAAIRTILQKTASDPLFDRLVDEIIENTDGINTSTEEENCKKAKCDEGTETPKLSPMKAEEDSIKVRLRSSKKLSETPAVPAQIQTTPQPTVAANPTNDIEVFDGSLDSYIKVNSGSSASSSNAALPQHSGGLLMVHPNSTVANVNSCYFINSDPLTVNIQQPSHFITNVLSDQDILTMPTVIVCDENQGKMPSSAITVSPYTNQQVQPKSYINIAPKQTLAEYITLYQCDDTPKKEQPAVTTSKSVTKPKPNVKLPVTKKPPTADPNQTKPQKTLKVIKPKAPKPEPEPVPQKTVCAPATPKGQTVEGQQGASTPRSGSHVRALDFSTPPRLVSPGRKENISASGKKRCSSTFKTLFGNEDSGAESGTKNEDSRKKNLDSWDSDLRCLIGSENCDANRSSPKKKTAKSKGKSKSKKKGENKVLNRTSEDGKLLEKALLEATPRKNSEKVLSVSDKTDDRSENNAESQKNKKPIETEVPKEVPILKIKEIKVLEFTEDASNKLILSPSKLNASKRTLIDPIDPKITPESAKPVPDALPLSTAKRNVTPLLETPIKIDVCPKTPGFFSPVNTNDTPFTKVLKEQLHGVDISTIPTPKFPVTPKFPFTPTIEDFCYANRPTDYSSSSSYYLPSDTEHGKSLEQILSEETKRLEANPATPGKSEKPEGKVVCVLDEVRIPPEDLEQTHQAIAEKMKSMGQNVIGRKNLSLVKSNASSSDSSDGSSSSDTSSDSTDDSWTAEVNETVVNNNDKDVAKAYTLRLRAESKGQKEIITEIISNVEIKSTLDVTKKGNFDKDYRDLVLAEMEEKKKKTIEKIQNENTNAGKTRSAKTPISAKKEVVRVNPPRDRFGKFVSKKASAKRKTKNSPSPTKTKKTTPNATTAKKQPPGTKKLQSPTEINQNAPTEAKVLHLSSDDEHLEPFEMVETELLETSRSSTHTASEEKKSKCLDISVHSFQKALDLAKSKQAAEVKRKRIRAEREAEDLVKGLKERGIHLMPKKLPANTAEKSKLQQKSKLDESLEEGEIVSDSESAEKGKNNRRGAQKEERGKRLSSRNLSTSSRSSRKQKNPGRCRRSPENKKDTRSNTLVLKPKESEGFEFDHRVNETETLALVHDASKPPPRKFSDYDLQLLDKTIEMNMYVEELDREVQKSMKVTPLQFILDIPSQSVSKRTRNVSGDSRIKKTSPLDLLSKQLTAECVSRSPIVNISPLDQLYVSERSNYLRNLSEKQLKDRKSKTSQNPAKAESKIATPGSDDKKHSKQTIDNCSKKQKAASVQRRKSCDTQAKSGVKSDEIREKSAEKLSIKSSTGGAKEQNSKMESPGTVEELDVVDGVIMLNATPNRNQTGEHEDDLMNYAIAGTPERCIRKRKAEEAENHLHEKKIKTKHCQELLKKIDVDTFLEQLHGEK